MKKMLSIAVVAGALLSVSTQPTLASAESALLPPKNSEAVTSSISMKDSETAWNKKAAEIIKKYKPGQPFSEEDAQFFRQNSNTGSGGVVTPAGLFGYQHGTFNGDAWITDTGSRVAFWGYVDTEFGILNHETKTNIMVKDDKLYSHKKLTINLHVTAIGPLGTGGTQVGIVADFDMTNSNENDHKLWQGKSQTWTAVPMSVIYTPKATVTDSRSETDITPPIEVTWSQTKP
ncbi:hypothetical protein [Paenibacillus elgii]|uniref:hypothetical protein n=1 Tax=Paenibacillus elgii TaxID=189691 RepID=UPI00203BBB56|nr:hypothetical protein [Paenibacillus elgii]MCM3270656.1 hypothetical protein [Paenibacillus elgii]